MPLLEQYEALFGDCPEMGRVLALMYADILKFHKRAIRFVTGKGISPLRARLLGLCLTSLVNSLAAGFSLNMEGFWDSIQSNSGKSQTA